MRRTVFSLLSLAIALFSLVRASWAATDGDWPGWRGADRTARSSETGLLDKWPEGGPRLVWKATGLGIGYSTPSIAGGSIFVLGNRDGKEYVIALDREREGAQIWATELGPANHDGGGYPGPRSTPTVDGDRVYGLGLSGELACLNAATGEIVWKKSLREKPFEGQVGGWGYCESVLIDGDVLVCTPGGPVASMLTLDKFDGKVIWQAKFGDRAEYSSIIKAEIDRVPQYIQFTGGGVIGVRARDGELLWRYESPRNGTANCSTPLCSGNLVFAASGYGTGGGLARVEKVGDKFTATEVYFTKSMRNHHGGMALVDDYLYGADEDVFTCLNFETGKVRWRDKVRQKSSLVVADGMIFARSEGGLVRLIKATPKDYEELGRFEQPERSDAPAWSHPVVAGGRLYLRDQDALFCYDVRGDASK